MTYGAGWLLHRAVALTCRPPPVGDRAERRYGDTPDDCERRPIYARTLSCSRSVTGPGFRSTWVCKCREWVLPASMPPAPLVHPRTSQDARERPPAVGERPWRVASYNVWRYSPCVIRNLADKETEKVWNGTGSRRLPADIQPVARRKLRMLNNAVSLKDLRIPSANRLQALKGGREGQHSIRINDPWRICFRWSDGDAHDVEIVDYH